MRGVLRGRSAKGHDSVIACALALTAEPTLGHPHQRVEPVKCTSETREQLRERVPARDVGKLVSQSDAAMLPWPIDRILREENDRRTPSPRKWSTDDRTGKEEHRLADSGVLALLLENPAPVGITERPRRRGDAIESHASDRKPRQDARESDCPEQRKDR